MPPLQYLFRFDVCDLIIVIRCVRFDVFVRFESRTYLDEHDLLLAVQQMLQVKSVDFFVFFPYFKKPAKLVFSTKKREEDSCLNKWLFFLQRLLLCTEF